MTIIVAQKTTTGVLMAADCSMVEEPRIFRRADQKLVSITPRIAVGTAGVARLGNAVRLSSFWEGMVAQHPLYDKPEEVTADLFKLFRGLLKNEPADTPFWAIVAVDSGIYYVGINGSVTPVGDAYCALGSAEFVALGALHVQHMQDQCMLPESFTEARERLLYALDACGEHVQAIRPPWTFVETKAPA